MVMQDVLSSQLLDRKNKWKIKIRFIKIVETFIKCKENKQKSKLMYRIILINGSKCSEKDTYAIE
jgi:hypothetical protein